VIRVYVAGRLDGGAIYYIQNLHRMLTWATELRRNGFSVLVPGLDLLLGLFAGNWEYEDYFDNNQPWLAVADALFLVPGWEGSPGTLKELEVARMEGIPVFGKFEELMKWRVEVEEKGKRAAGFRVEGGGDA